MRPWCKNGVQKPTPKLKEIEFSFLQHSIRLEKTSDLKKRKSKSDEKWPSYAHLKSRAKVAAGPFWAKIWDFGLIFDIWTSYLICPSLTSILIGNPIVKSIGPNLAILSH